MGGSLPKWEHNCKHVEEEAAPGSRHRSRDDREASSAGVGTGLSECLRCTHDQPHASVAQIAGATDDGTANTIRATAVAGEHSMLRVGDEPQRSAGAGRGW